MEACCQCHCRLTRDFIIPPWSENLLPANVVPLSNDHDEIKRLLSRLEACAREFSHAVNTLKKSFAPRPRLLQTPSGQLNGVQNPKHHRPERQNRAPDAHCSSSNLQPARNWKSSPTKRSLLHQALISVYSGGWRKSWIGY